MFCQAMTHLHTFSPFLITNALSSFITLFLSFSWTTNSRLINLFLVLFSLPMLYRSNMPCLDHCVLGLCCIFDYHSSPTVSENQSYLKMCRTAQITRLRFTLMENFVTTRSLHKHLVLIKWLGNIYLIM